MGPAYNSLVDGYVVNPDPTPLPTNNNGGATMGAVMGPSPQNTAAAADLQGTPPLTGTHNTPLHVAFLGIIALAVIYLLRKGGFHGMVAGRASLGGR